MEDSFPNCLIVSLLLGVRQFWLRIRSVCPRLRIFAEGYMVSSGISRYNNKSRVFCVKAESEDGFKVIWVAKVLLLFSLSVSGGHSVEDFAYVQYTEVTDPVSNIDIN